METKAKQTPFGPSRIRKLGTPLALLVVAGIASLAAGCASSAVAFDPELWKNQAASVTSEGGVSPRLQMVDSVIANVLPGLNQNEVTSSLGKPTETEYFADLRPDLIYVLGPERGFISIDYEWLLIWFDDDGVVDRTQIATD